MTTTIREQIIEAIIAQLNTGAPAGVPTLTRVKMEPNQPGQLPAMTIFPLREEVNHAPAGKWGHVVMRSLTLRIVVEAEGNPVDQQLDPIIAWLSQLGGSQLGGLAVDVEEQNLEWAYEESDNPYVALALDLRVDYVTNKSDQTSVT